MTDVTLVFAYFNNAGMLSEQYRRFKDLPPDLQRKLRLIVVDDCSSVPAWRQDIGFPVRVFRLLPPKVRWNQDACRNVGAHHVETSWMMLLDIDHIPTAGLLHEITTRKLDPDMVYRPAREDYVTMQPYKIHPNSWLVTKDLFDTVGGYDERLAGNYGTDGDFSVRLRAAAVDVVYLAGTILRVGREAIPDASTPREYGRKNPADKDRITELLKERQRTAPNQTVRLSFPWEEV